MIIRSIGGESNNIVGASKKQADNSFNDILAKAFETVNGYQKGYDDALKKLIAGEDISVHEVMIAAEKAKLSLELAVQVRNKAIEAYQEIMRMQI
ncbi:flagellar hook-basal body complex protein FliE [Thermosediminibacter oceani]|uniref:Flagellar hook-basal body complex protein FliE n=1 Tax=Thermosediminibacter oceani (strain ATCC BAA-1034 / DSM 16646 / JW/IW-1228P) TaxID=555079 RepID=D9S378_THEOJ|nr:flagellar hook-basal body complex protein FliE [Thermosediminibacter oceani]ADL07855.1 flagellar hook-basal body complex subunit FliE [Thermosediminibacter oceani DSM 16646]